MGTVEAPNLSAVLTLHQMAGWAAVSTCGLVGLWGVILSRRAATPRAFFPAVTVAIAVTLSQVVLGVSLLSNDDLTPGDQHTFYGFVIAFTLAFTYIYRVQFRKRPTLAYGLLLLFIMGLGLRGIATVGVNF